MTRLKKIALWLRIAYRVSELSSLVGEEDTKKIRGKITDVIKRLSEIRNGIKD